MAELSTSQLKKYNLTLCDGEAVVRNQNRINGLIGVRSKDIPAQYHGLLAKANFTGNVVNESIIWTSDVFKSEPVRLSDLHGEEHTRYNDILDDALASYASAVSTADERVRKLLYAAITYPSESAVYCADGRVVITEWGMTPVGEKAPIGMPYSIDDPDKVRTHRPGDTVSAGGDDNGDINVKGDDDLPDGRRTAPDIKTDEPDVSGTGGRPRPDNDTTGGNTGTTGGNVPEKSETSGRNTGGGGAVVPPPPGGGGAKKPWWKKWWLWLLALLALLLLIGLFKDCGGPAPVAPVPVTSPELNPDDVTLTEDSVRYVAGDRVILLITDKEKSMDSFVSDFRAKYPDADKYALSNVDTVIGRVTLVLPKEERTAMSEKLPAEFADYGLVVIPETMYKTDATANDPALQDAQKRWHFDETSVFDAWDETMGSDEIVVAVIDDGFDLSHPELAGKIVKPYNAVTHDSNVFPSKSGHGTHVAATAVGNANNGAGTAGIAPGCKLMPIQVGDRNGQMTTSAILDAVVYAIKNGADVVNMSLGMSFGPFAQFAPQHVQKNFRANMLLDEQRVWDYLFDIARQNNVTFVLAGGNENILIGLDPMQRSSNTIKVSATQPDRYKASFSNYGDMSVVSAPGVDIYNAIPGGRYTVMDGTSMASPIVAGGVALLKSKDRTLSTADIANILRETGNPSPSDVGPIVNFARALKADPALTDGDCEEVNRRYNELLQELEQLRRDHPGCIQQPDTLALPEDFTPADLTGRWKSTTTLTNMEDEEVVLYFTFDGTPSGRLDVVEPDGTTYTAPLSVSVSNDVAYIDQTAAATAPGHRGYNPYNFVIKPDRNRKAEGRARNKVEAQNQFEFRLTRI